MISPEDLIRYCLSKHMAYIDYPFGEEPMCFKVNKRIFAELYLKKENYKITLKCEPFLADFYRRQYPDAVARGYHCPPLQQPHRNTVWIGRIEDSLLFDMVDHSYDEVIKGFSKKQQNEIMNGKA